MLKEFLSTTLSRNKIPYRLASDDKWIRLETCPYCIQRGHTKNDGYTMCLSTQVPTYYCHRCHATGYTVKILERFGLQSEWNQFVFTNINSANKLFAQNMVRLDDVGEFTGEKLSKGDFVQFKKSYEVKNLYYNMARNYLISRGFHWEYIRRKMIIISDKSDAFSKRYFGRIILPDISYTGFTARDYLHIRNKDYKLRYLSSGNASVFGGIVNSKDTNLIINEGPLDAIKLNQFGYNAFGIGGKSKASTFFKSNQQTLKNYNIIYIIENDVSFFEKDLIDIFSLTENIYDNIFYIDMAQTKYKDMADIEDPTELESILKDNKIAISQRGTMLGLLKRTQKRIVGNEILI